ncbi:cytochrome b N-terminal domain-containing protein [Streptomyces sp. NBC_00390]|uniref:cytochrome b N-terminal domain-containing protein n=1 Tax=Streptomyces sp. NBC_00390 TaxID=2975736 RepID=UPI002E22FC8A
MRDLVSDVWLGGFARALHYWAAQAMFVFALLHLLRVFFHASYKKPREGNWVLGAAMFLLTFLAVFTGTVLKWDQEGYEALIHNLDVAELLGGAGIWFTGELTDRVPILLRLYSAHVVIIPGLVLLLFVWHALLVKRHQISPHPEIPVPEVETLEPFTAHLKRVAAFGLMLLGVLPSLACSYHRSSARRRSRRSRSPARCGCSGGSSPWRSASGSPRSRTSSQACSG